MVKKRIGAVREVESVSVTQSIEKRDLMLPGIFGLHFRIYYTGRKKWEKMDGKEGGRGERVEGSKELERRKSKDEKTKERKGEV